MFLLLKAQSVKIKDIHHSVPTLLDAQVGENTTTSCQHEDCSNDEHDKLRPHILGENWRPSNAMKKFFKEEAIDHSCSPNATIRVGCNLNNRCYFSTRQHFPKSRRGS